MDQQQLEVSVHNCERQLFEHPAIESRFHATHDFPTSLTTAIILAPGLMALVCAVFLLNPTTRRASLWMLAENHPVELLTFAVAFAGGALGLSLAWRVKKHGENTLAFVFYALFSAALVFVGLEEVAWGQKWLGFDLPAAWRSINVQGETTIHNIAGIHGRTEIFRMMFGLGGLVGVGLSRYPSFKKIGPPAILFPWFVVIALHAGVDVYNDYYPIGRQFDFNVQRTSELVELLIAISGFLYLLLNAKMVLSSQKSSIQGDEHRRR